MAAQYLLCLLQRCAFRSRYKVVLCHKVGYGLGEISLKLKVAVGEYSYQLAVAGYRYSGNMKTLHQFQCICKVVIFGKIERIRNNPMLRALHSVNLHRLFLYRHIFMKYADTAFTRHCYCKPCLGNGVHCRAHKRNVESDLVRKLCPQKHLVRSNLAAGRNQQDIVKG